MTEVRWERYPRVAASPHARDCLRIQADLGLARNTIGAYGRALQDYLAFGEQCGVSTELAGRGHVASYVRHLTTRPRAPHGGVGVAGAIEGPMGLANATIQQRLTAIRLYYDYLVEEGLRQDNPVGRGRYTAGKGFGGRWERSLVPRLHHQPWIPTDAEWQAVLSAAQGEPVRNRLMLALSYDAGLRREELCALEIGDIDPARRLVRVRAETTKNRQGRVVPYSAAPDVLYAAYLGHRRSLSRARGPLFVSEARRDCGQPVTIWTWSKVVRRLAERAGVPRFTPHTLRHLCLTDLARAGWDLHEIARFAGHRSTQTTLLYIHLSGRDLAAKLERGVAQLRAWRVATMAEVLR